MDMSFPPRIGEPLAPPRLDFQTLVAGLARQAARSSNGDGPSDAPCGHVPGVADDLCLAAVILGRPGWRDAARALGGGFSADERPGGGA